MAARHRRCTWPMLKLVSPILADLAAAPLDLTPERYGLVTACDNGLLEASGLSVPVGSLCRIAHGPTRSLSAEVIGFRNGRTLMMMLGDSVMLRPGARVYSEGRPGLLPVGEAFLGRAVDGEALPIDNGGPIHARSLWPAGGVRTGALDRSPVRMPFETGVRALNALTTFGQGQRIGVMAGSGVGKSVLIDMIAHGADADVIVVGLIGERAREIGLLLGEPGAARGYPPSALATITRLVERAGNSAASGGSITGLYTVLADGDDENDPVVDTARSILDGHVVLSRELAQRGQYPAIDIAASLSRVMVDIASPEHVEHARLFRALSATYEANRDLVLMGAYRAGADAQLDRAIAMHEALAGFLAQPPGAFCSLGESARQLAALVGADAA